MNIVYRRNNRFIINKDYIKSGVNKEQICTSLYAELYLEFRGASKHRDYSKLTYLERLRAVNDFAKEWLQNKGFYNEAEE